MYIQWIRYLIICMKGVTETKIKLNKEVTINILNSTIPAFPAYQHSKDC